MTQALLDRVAALPARASTGRMCEIIGVSRPTLLLWAKKGLIPGPAVINSRTRSWDVAGVLKAIAQRQEGDS